MVGLNNLGGCSGSTGPTSINPETGRRYGPEFPLLAVRDWVNSQARLADRLGIKNGRRSLAAHWVGCKHCAGPSNTLSDVANAVIVASAPKLTAQNIAFNEVARQAISKDPDFHDGYYYEHNTPPKTGLMQARMLGHITYLSAASMREKFGRELKPGNTITALALSLKWKVICTIRVKSSANTSTPTPTC